MRKHNLAIIKSFVYIWLVGTVVNAQSTEHMINRDLSLKIEPIKSVYRQLEPIALRCSFSNETDSHQATLAPVFLQDGILVVSHGKEKRMFADLTIFASMLSRRPVIFEPGRLLQEDVTFEKNLHEVFPRPGNYLVQLMLGGSQANEGIKSNVIEITITVPTGIDKEAFDFIQHNRIHNRYPVLFLWDNTVVNQDGKILLEEFVSKFGGSIYGEYAILQLGNYYFRSGQMQKAREQLEPLTLSSNGKIAREAEIVLAKVRK